MTKINVLGDINHSVVGIIKPEVITQTSMQVLSNNQTDLVFASNGLPYYELMALPLLEILAIQYQRLLTQYLLDKLHLDWQTQIQLSMDQAIPKLDLHVITGMDRFQAHLHQIFDIFLPIRVPIMMCDLVI